VTKGAVADLMASILAHGGVLHNLVVTDGGDGTYRVIDGARRLEALQALQADGKLPADYAVACHVTGEAEALESSLAANTIRLAMHPADEYEAFAKLAGDGQTPEQIAERFGKNTRHVEQRLKLGNAAPKLLAEFRAENLTLDALMAFAITDDRKRQMKVYRSLKESDSLYPRAIRAALTETMLEADSKLVKFVGLEAYRQAGGTTQSDLFSETVYLENPDLLNDLAAAKLDSVKRELEAEGWGWIEISHDQDWEIVSRCGRIRQQLRDVPQELIDRRERAEAELAETEQSLEDSESDALIDAQDAAETSLQATEREISAFAAYDPDHIAIAGCYVSIGHDGSLDIDKGLVRKQDMKLLGGTGHGAPPKPKGMSQSLRRDLEAYRLQAAQVEIARNPLVALDLLVFTAARETLSTRVHSGPDVVFEKHQPKVKEPTPAANALKAIEVALPVAWLHHDAEADQFQEFRKLTDTQKLDILAWSVATTVKPQLATGNEATACETALSLTAGDVAAYWRPTVANYLGRINRDQLLTLGRDLLGEAWSQSRSRLKKSEAAAELERAFADPQRYGRTPRQIADLTRWLPEGMAFNAQAVATPVKAKKARKAA
jgi:ParB family chromosome partitioning protein